MLTKAQRINQLKADLFNLVLSELKDKLPLRVVIKRGDVIIVKSSPAVHIEIGAWVDDPSLNYRDLSKITLRYGEVFTTKTIINLGDPNFITQIIKFINNAPRWKAKNDKKK